MPQRPGLSRDQDVGITLSGGGTRLYAHLGVLTAAEGLGLRPVELMGVSGGALVAAAYAALGYERAVEVIRGFAIERALRFGWLRNMGWYDNRDVAAFAREVGITWEAVRARGIQLHVGVTALEPGMPLAWSADSHPDGVDLAEAVRISSSIPLLWGYTRMPTSMVRLPGLPADASVPPVLTLVDGGVSNMLLTPSDVLPWVASNIAFNGYRTEPIAGFVDYMAQMLSSLQYRAMQPALQGASCVVKHRAFRATGWLDKITPEGIDSIIEQARDEARMEILLAIAGGAR